MSNFAAQWLQLRQLRNASPDPTVFPEFDENLRRAAMRRETELFMESQLREDRSILDLLRADYTFVNERLATHYGIPNVYGNHFRRVTVDDENRAGLLGQGSILTLTSYPNRTSPVLRGKWVLENLLSASPPPPPPDVPALEDGNDGTPRSVREQMRRHSRSPACAGCHNVMDPIGFSLESFDAIGRWCSVDETGIFEEPPAGAPSVGTEIDPTGVLPDGTAFSGPAGLRRVLLDRHEEFVRTVAERLLMYALGRPVEYYDMPAVRQVLRRVANDDNRWSSLVLEIVKSAPFQMRRPQS